MKNGSDQRNQRMALKLLFLMPLRSIQRAFGKASEAAALRSGDSTSQSNVCIRGIPAGTTHAELNEQILGGVVSRISYFPHRGSDGHAVRSAVLYISFDS